MNLNFAITSRLPITCLILLGATFHSQANPTGGQVAAGSASINTIPGTVTINQISNQAVINWNSFSIGSGELTQFLQPSSQSAVLNRVLGGQTSIINGSLQANGQVYLLNGNGILIGPGGNINANSFTASTRDISDSDFLSGNLHFTGSGNGGVSNLGTVKAIGGDVIFIGKTVDNEGSLSAPNGHVGLAAGDDVTITQSGMEHVFVRATSTASSAAGKTAVNNSGTISAATAELKAANGNIYALAVNNSGIIRANGVSKQDGRIFLVAEGNLGTTQNTGTLTARAKDGTGGFIETSGGTVVAHGKIDAGQGGTWSLDPYNLNIDAATAANIETNLSTNGSTVTFDTTGNDPATGTSDGTGEITVNSAITWTSTGTLNLDAFHNLTINAPITATSGTLTVASDYNNAGGGGTITTGASGVINVGTFNLTGGSWVQNSATPPSFAASNFIITSGSFLRAIGGTGSSSNPYSVFDVYGLQGIGSSTAYLADSWRLAAPSGSNSTVLDASGTVNWNGNAGFVPIGTFTGTFNGNGISINGLTINLPTTNNVGLFSMLSVSGSLIGVTLNQASITGSGNVGALVGNNLGQINGSDVYDSTITGGASSPNIGGLVGENVGLIENSFAGFDPVTLLNTTTTGASDVGGLVGFNSGTLEGDAATGTLNETGATYTVDDSMFGGLVGQNTSTGSITLSNVGENIATIPVLGSMVINTPYATYVGGLVGYNSGLIAASNVEGAKVTGYTSVGGFIGDNEASSTVEEDEVFNGTSSLSVTGTQYVGGFVGYNLGEILGSAVVAPGGSVLAQDANMAGVNFIGGFVGRNSALMEGDAATVNVGEAAGTSDAYDVGGFGGFNTGNVYSVSAGGNVTGYDYVGGLMGYNSGQLGVEVSGSGMNPPPPVLTAQVSSGATTVNAYTVTGDTNVGGLVGYNNGADIGIQAYSTDHVVGATNVGGLIGYNNTPGFTFTSLYAKGSVTGNQNVGGLIGDNVAGDLASSYASGAVTGTGSSQVYLGGLIGANSTTITLSYATGNVTGDASSLYVGGLVGINTGTISSDTVGSHTYASGAVTGGGDVGGLVGLNDGTIGDPTATIVEALEDYTQATGKVTALGNGPQNFGGLVGENAGLVQQATASGEVDGTASSLSVGGLVGLNLGTITVSFASNNVYGNGTAAVNGSDTDSFTGGLVGKNQGTISASYATGSVVGDSYVGGLVGENYANNSYLVETSYSTSTVSGFNYVGGLVGLNYSGTITQDYAAGDVSAVSNFVGGLVGLNLATISETYATGNVSGSGDDAGGLVGYNGDTVDQSYATGQAVLSGPGAGTYAGGLVGFNVSSISNSYWDETSSGTNTGVGGGTTTGATPLTSLTAYTTGSYVGTMGTPAGFGYSLQVPTGSTADQEIIDGSGSVAWYQINGSTRPYLAWELPTNSHTETIGGASYYLVYTPHELQLMAMDVTQNYVLGKSIDLSVTENENELWNPATGFSPIGSDSAPFTGNFNGAKYGISGLYINQPTQDNLGLFGANSGSITSVTLSGQVTGNGDVGLLVGENGNGVFMGGTISNVNIGGSTSTVTGGIDGSAGGIAGFNSGTIETFADNVAVSGNGAIGGAVGYNYTGGTIQDGYSIGNVNELGNSEEIGGLVGANMGSIAVTYATGTVAGGSGNAVGGLVGENDSGSIDESYATGAVSSTGDGVGGLVGFAYNTTITETYATGAVSGNSQVGGLIGCLFSGSANSSYASGQVTGTGGGIGGLIGLNSGTYADLYWDSVDASVAAPIGSTVSTTGTTDLNGTVIASGNATTTYEGFDYNGGMPPVGFTLASDTSTRVLATSDTDWRIQVGNEFPLLTKLSTQVSGVAYNDPAHTALATGQTITFTSNNNGTPAFTKTQTTDANGAFDFLFAADDGLNHYIPNIGATLLIQNQSNNADSIAATLYNSNGVPNLLADVAPADTWAQTVRAVSNGLNNTLLAGSGSMYVGSDPTDLNTTGGTNLLITESFEVAPNLSGGYGINGDINADGNITFDSAGTVPKGYNTGVTLQAVATTPIPHPTFTINAPISSNVSGRSIIIETAGNFVNTAGTGGISTPNGNFIVYSQNPQDSNNTVEDANDGLEEYHLYGTDPTETPAYLLDPTLNYQIYTFTPTLTLQAVANGTNGTYDATNDTYTNAQGGVFDAATGLYTVPYGTAVANLTYSVQDTTYTSGGVTYYLSGVLPGDQLYATGNTQSDLMNAVLSSLPTVDAQPSYTQFSPAGSTYSVQFNPATEGKSLIGYKIVYAPGTIQITQNQTATITIDVSGSQNFGYIGTGGSPTYVQSVSGYVPGDLANIHPTYSTTVGKYTDADPGSPYADTISAANLPNYANIVVMDLGYTVNKAPAVVSAKGTTEYGNNVNPVLTLNGSTSTNLYQGVAFGSGSGSTPSATDALSTVYTASTDATSTSNITTGTNTYTATATATNGSFGAAITDNYNISTVTGVYTVTPRPLIIDTVSTANIYDGTVMMTSFDDTDYSIDPTTSLASTDTLSGDMARNTPAAVNAGFYQYTIGTLGVTNGVQSEIGNYTVTFNPQNLGYTIIPRDVYVAANNAMKTYGDSFTATQYTVTGSTATTGFVGPDAISSLTLAIANGGGDPTANVTPALNAPYTITVNTNSITGNYTAGNYTIVTTPGNLTINRADVTVTANNAMKTYGDTTTFAGTEFTYTPLQNGETLTSASISSTGSVATAGVGNSPYDILISGAAGTGFNAANYNVDYVNGNLTINRADVTVTANNAMKTYGDTTTFAGTEFTYTPLQNGETLTSASISSTGSVATAGVGNSPYDILISGAAGTGFNATNYNVTYVNGKLTVNPADVTVTANNAMKTYGDTTTFAGTEFTYTALQNGETLTSANLSSTGAVATAGVGSSPYDILISGAAGNGFNATNYNVTYVNGKLTVNPADVTITANNAMKTYGDTTTFAGTEFTYTALQNGETLTSANLSSTGAVATAGVGSSPYDILISGAAGNGFNAANYDVTYVKGKLTVNPADVTITANNAMKTYGDTTTFAGTEFTYTALQNGETLTSANLSSTGSVATAGVGNSPYDILISGAAGNGFNAANYDVTYVKGKLTVNPADVTVTANNAMKTYGDTTTFAGIEFTYTALQNGETLTSANLSSTGAVATAGVGNSPYDILISGAAGNGFNAANYDVTYVKGKLTVNPADVTITADNAMKTYGTTLTFGGTEFTYTPLQNGETLTSATISSTGSVATAGVGSSPYDILISGAAGTGFNAGNYNVTYTKGHLTVNPADLVITADPQNKLIGLTFVFNGTEFTETGLVNNDTLTSAGLSSPGTPSAALPGQYVINYAVGSAIGTGLSNYTISFQSAPFVVDPGIIGQPSEPGSLRADYDELSGILYDDTYGIRRFYQLEVPGRITRIIPSQFAGIGSGSSLVHTTIGMDTLYHVDRFQTYRH